MSDIDELSGRIMAAMDRVAMGVDALGKNDAGQIQDLQQALADEKEVNAQLSERVRVLADRQDQAIAALEAKAEEATSRVAALDDELQKLKKANGLLSDACGALRTANAEGVGDADLINKAMEVELEAIRAMRSAEVLEADQILSALTPLLAASATPQDTEEAH